MKPLPHVVIALLSALCSVWGGCFLFHLIAPLPDWMFLPMLATSLVFYGAHAANIAWAFVRLEASDLLPGPRP